VIPTLLLIGLALGRWWRVVVPVATIGWVLILIATGTGSGLSFALSAALLAAANLAVGVLVFQGGRSLFRLSGGKASRAAP
jgi:hypothetical protein